MTSEFEPGESYVTFDIPEESIVIQEPAQGPVIVGIANGKRIALAEDVEDAERIAAEWMRDHGFYPDCYLVNERGNVTQLIPNGGE